MNPQKCESCQKHPASVHEYKVRYPDQTGEPEAKVHQSHFCAPCAKAAGIPVPENVIAPTKIVSVLGKALLSQQKAASGAASEPQCPECGWTWRDFRQTSRFGCPNDYDVFAEQLPDLLDRLHGSSEHQTSEEEAELARLVSQMNEAAEQEDYEAAARIRDQIQGLEDSLTHLEAPGEDPV